MSEKYDVIHDKLITVEKTRSSSLASTKTTEKPIYFNYYGATDKLGSLSDPMKQKYILYSYNGSSSDEGSYDKNSGKFVAKQGNYFRNVRKNFFKLKC